MGYLISYAGIGDDIILSLLFPFSG